MKTTKTHGYLLTFSISNDFIRNISKFLNKYLIWIIAWILIVISIFFFIFYFNNGLGLAYNDARSHLNIGRRVVEGLKPGLAQLGSVWLPLPHILMIFTIWNDFMWHSGMAGTIVSMICFVVTGLLIYLFLKKLNVGIVGRIIGVIIFAANLNILYLQSTAMTELLLIATMTAGSYELMLWSKNENYLHLISSAFFVMLSTLTRYDGWFLLFWSILIIIFITLKNRGYKVAEGTFILFGTLAGLGIFLWLVWNQLIFKDVFYFILGPFSAKAQQDLLEQAGVLATKFNLLLSTKVYFYALIYNIGALTVFVGLIGFIVFSLDNIFSKNVRLAVSALMAPLVFNILALFLGHSVLYVQGISGDTWFNVRYGIMLLPSIAIFCGYLIDKAKNIKWLLMGFLIFSTFYALVNGDAVTIDDARVGSSQKNVTEVSSWLKANALNKDEFILISAASHDAIIFSSGLPMKRFIHEGTDTYWNNATSMPDRWARWIIMRTHDDNDLTWRSVSRSPGFDKYYLVNSFPFADIYEIKPEYLGQLSSL